MPRFAVATEKLIEMNVKLLAMELKNLAKAHAIKTKLHSLKLFSLFYINN